MPNRKPFRIPPRFHDKVWGSTEVEPWFSTHGKARTGEVWFQTEPPLPLLTKFIFTNERLSIQVHPNDRQAIARGLKNGKTEMWHILRAEPGACVALGFRRDVSPEEMRSAASSGEIVNLVDWIPVEAGDTIFTPASTVHALGAGLALVEIQQNSDTTYRLWDYGRGRELHLEDGLSVADGSPARFRPQKGRPLADGETRKLVECDCFAVEEIRADSSTLLSTAAREKLLVVLEGSGVIVDEPYRAGEVWRLDGNAGECRVQPSAPSRFLWAGEPGTS